MPVTGTANGYHCTILDWYAGVAYNEDWYLCLADNDGPTFICYTGWFTQDPP